MCGMSKKEDTLSVAAVGIFAGIFIAGSVISMVIN